MAASLFMINRQYPQAWRNLYKLFGVTVAVGLVSIPIILIIKQNNKFVTYLKEQIANILEIFTGSFLLESGTYETGLIRSLFNPEQILLTVKAIFFRNYLFL